MSVDFMLDLFFRPKDLAVTISEDQSNVKDWFNANKFSMNIEKTQCIYFQREQIRTCS